MTTFKKITLVAALSALFIQAPFALADDEAKAIHVRESQAEAGKTVQLTVSAVKKQFKVDEPIQFKVKGNRDYYLYVYNFDASTGESVLLLPNKKVKANLFKGGKFYNLPSKNVEFVSDEAGTEHLMFIASKDKIDIDSVALRSVGDFGKANTKDLESAFSKTIRVRDAQPGSGNGSASLSIKIVD